jgi:Domain of unknown function (DUF4136)
MDMRRLALVAMATLMGSAVLAQDVKTDYEKDYDYSKIKTFSVKLGTSWNNPLGEERVIAIFEKALEGKGWKKVDANPDALVVMHGATQVKRSLNTFYSDMGGYGGYGWRGGYGGGMGSSTTTESEYTVGTLVVDIYDAGTKKLLFRGVGSDELSDKPEKNQKKAQKGAEKMFKKFPPKPEEKKG